MRDKPCILAIDQGTTSSRAILFDKDTNVIATVQQEFPQLHPAEGWVEHNPEAILGSVLAVSRETLVKAQEQGFTVACIGITNQRETSIVWNRATGKAIYNAIVWQDRRTADQCDELKQANREAEGAVSYRVVAGPLLFCHQNCLDTRSC